MARIHRYSTKKTVKPRTKRTKQEEMSLAEYNEYLSSSPREKKKRAHPEHDQQVLFIQWTRQEDVLENYPELDMLYAIPNGGFRAWTTSKEMKAEGERKGVPDLHLPVARGNYHSLYIEMKAPKTDTSKQGTVSTEQKWWIKRLLLEGNCIAVCYSADEAKNVCRHYLNGNHGLIVLGKVVDKIRKEIGL